MTRTISTTKAKDLSIYIMDVATASGKGEQFPYLNQFAKDKIPYPELYALELLAEVGKLNRAGFIKVPFEYSNQLRDYFDAFIPSQAQLNFVLNQPFEKLAQHYTINQNMKK